MNIADTGCSTRIGNTLIRAGINTTEQLAKKSDYDLSFLRFSKDGLEEVILLKQAVINGKFKGGRYSHGKSNINR